MESKERYAELMALGRDEVDRLCKIYAEAVIVVPSSTNYTTGKRTYEKPVPEGAIAVAWYSNATHFIVNMPQDLKRLSPKQLEQLSYYNNDKFRPPFWAFED